MCEICRQTPCNQRCPNAPARKSDLICIECGEAILPDERFLENEDGPICECCVDNMSRNELLEFFGIYWETYRE